LGEPLWAWNTLLNHYNAVQFYTHQLPTNY
jgi:hypothetical protein